MIDAAKGATEIRNEGEAQRLRGVEPLRKICAVAFTAGRCKGGGEDEGQCSCRQREVAVSAFHKQGPGAGGVGRRGGSRPAAMEANALKLSRFPGVCWVSHARWCRAGAGHGVVRAKAGPDAVTVMVHRIYKVRSAASPISLPCVVVTATAALTMDSSPQARDGAATGRRLAGAASQDLPPGSVPAC